MKWTDEQRDIIDARGCEILVSAAAGSGKTAVLVERLYERIMDPKHKVDIDRFVVVTFTKAAAAEMKDRLRKRLEKALAEENLSPDDMARVRAQLRLVPSAHISTVHSFCNYVIGQYFHRIGLDPSYVQASDSELKLIRKEVVDRLIEKEYADEKKDFMRLANLRALNKKDAPLEKWILDVYDKSTSEPFSDILFDEWERLLDTPLTDAGSPYLKGIIMESEYQAVNINSEIKKTANQYSALKPSDYNTFDGIERLAEEIITAAGQAGGELTYAEAFDKIYTAFDSISLKGLPQKVTNKDEYRDAAIEAVAPFRKTIEDMRMDWFGKPVEKHDKDREIMATNCKAIIRLAKDFASEFAQEKKDRGVVDYNDLEQFALSILYDTDEETGKRVRSEAAMEMADYFEEIMIDEYQDSNRVQDAILWAVSKDDGSAGSGDAMPWECTSKNRFMVGDIKQSIYRFRNACPELFEHKLNTFLSDKNAPHVRMDLNKNFRSKEVVIDSVNAVFKHIMHPDIGGVEYDEKAKLVYFPVDDISDGKKVADKVYVDRFSNSYIDKTDDYELEYDCDRDQAEAVHIAHRIKEMVEGDDPLYVTEDGARRKVRYSDIVILSRGVSPIAYTYTEEFGRLGIPFVTEVREGFYGTREVSLVLQMLDIIDNPIQDIPLAGVLTSPMFEMTEEMLAEVRISEGKGTRLYHSLTSYVENADGKEEIKKELERFFEILNYLRDRVLGAPLSLVLSDIYDITGIYSYFASLNDGKRRCANLDRLEQMVLEFEQGSYHSVRDFINYISEMRQEDKGQGEAVTIGENDDVVRLMSIHKSKGLEFPVVILARTASEGKKEDLDRFVFNTEYGIAGYVDDQEKGWYREPLVRKAVIDKNYREGLGELFRLLYVAMTRAKEQLIITTCIPKKNEPDVSTDHVGRSKMKTFIQMLRPAVEEDKDGSIFITKDYGYPYAYWEGSPIATGITDSVDSNIFDTSNVYNIHIRKLIDDASEAEEAELPPSKMSVSEIKRASMSEPEEEIPLVGDLEKLSLDDEASDAEGQESPDDTDVLPRFMRSDKADDYTGAERGTIYHKVMSTLDFELASDSVQDALEKVVRDMHILPEKMKVVDKDRIDKFFVSDLGARMTGAYREGRLHREMPFMIAKPAREIPGYEDSDENASVMIQGIIDGYFKEDDHIVLMDYKTDRIPKDRPEELIERYKVQMELYKEAIEKSIGETVGECYLYSFHLNKEIKVPL